jgi:hypothetical protein
MGTVLILGFVVLVGPLALVYGVDSRPQDVRGRGKRWL